MADYPLVSAITPVYKNQEFLKRCGDCFLLQDYPHLEWVILDDSPESVRDLFPTDPRIRYYYELPKRNHGEKMNRCCELASGNLVIVWDSDDWYASDRITRQVAPFADPNIMVTGTSRLYYYLHGAQKKAYRYQNWTIQKWIGAIALRKSVWEKQKFNPISQGADVQMLNTIPHQQWADLNDLTLLIATIHEGNARNGKNLPNMSFIDTPWEEIEKITKGTLCEP